MNRRTTWVLVAATIITVLLTAGITSARRPHAIPIAEAQTVIVYSPHPDDETYGMGQAIAEQAMAGRRVVGVLLTDGEGSGDVPEWISTRGTDMDLDGDVDKWDFGHARRAEYRAAMDALGAEDIVFLGGADSQGASGFRDTGLSDSIEDVRVALRSVATSISPDAPVAHMTVATVDDPDPLVREPREHPDHTALVDVVSSLAADSGSELYLYKVYVFYQIWPLTRWAPTMVRGSDEAIARKRKAIEAYAEIGKSSTARLWTEAYESKIEYLAVSR